MLYAQLHLTLPAWVHEAVDTSRTYASDEDKVALAVDLVVVGPEAPLVDGLPMEELDVAAEDSPGPRIIDPTATGAIDPAAAQGFTTSPLQAMPSAFTLCVRRAMRVHSAHSSRTSCHSPLPIFHAALE